MSVAQIAEAVGIKAPSLYKHYKSKQDIFDAILMEMEKRYEQQTLSMQINGTNPQNDSSVFAHMDENHLVEIGKSLFLYFLHDEYVSKFRRMLTIEQYHNKKLSKLYIQQYIDSPLSYQGMLFGLLMQIGIFISESHQIMALQFYAPMFLLLTMCDCQPEKEAEAIILIEQHIRQFSRVYHRKEG